MKEGVAIQTRLAPNASARLLTDLTGRHYTLVLEVTMANLATLEATVPQIFGDKDLPGELIKR